MLSFLQSLLGGDRRMGLNSRGYNDYKEFMGEESTQYPIKWDMPVEEESSYKGISMDQVNELLARLEQNARGSKRIGKKRKKVPMKNKSVDHDWGYLDSPWNEPHLGGHKPTASDFYGDFIDTDPWRR